MPLLLHALLVVLHRCHVQTPCLLDSTRTPLNHRHYAPLNTPLVQAHSVTPLVQPPHTLDRLNMPHALHKVTHAPQRLQQTLTPNLHRAICSQRASTPAAQDNTLKPRRATRSRRASTLIQHATLLPMQLQRLMRRVAMQAARVSTHSQPLNQQRRHAITLTARVVLRELRRVRHKVRGMRFPNLSKVQFGVRFPNIKLVRLTFTQTWQYSFCRLALLGKIMTCQTRLTCVRTRPLKYALTTAQGGAEVK